MARRKKNPAPARNQTPDVPKSTLVVVPETIHQGKRQQSLINNGWAVGKWNKYSTSETSGQKELSFRDACACEICGFTKWQRNNFKWMVFLRLSYEKLIRTGASNWPTITPIQKRRVTNGGRGLSEDIIPKAVRKNWRKLQFSKQLAP